MKRCIGYVRVSKDPKGDKISPHAQEDTITAYCQFKGWELVDVVTDIDFTGKNFDRPGWQSILERLDDYDVIIVTELTRFGRSAGKAAQMVEFLHGVGKDIVSTREDIDTTTSTGALIWNVMISLAQFESDRLSERMQEVHGKIARNGTKKGGPLPLGYVYDDDNNVLIDENEAAIVRYIYQLRVEGNGTRGIAFRLNDEGFTTKQGKIFKHGTLYSVLRNYTYVCKRNYGGEVYDLNVPRIIDDETWAAVRAMDGKPAPTGRGRHLLSGLIRCSGCGDTLSHDGEMYRCHDARGVCAYSCSVTASIVETYVVEQFFERVESYDYRAAVRKAAGKVKARGKKADTLKRKLDALKVRQARLFDDRYGEGATMTALQFNEYNSALLDDMAGVLEKIAALEDSGQPDRLKELGNIRKDWESYSREQRRRSLALWIERVTVNPGRGTGRLEISWKE